MAGSPRIYHQGNICLYYIILDNIYTCIDIINNYCCAISMSCSQLYGRWQSIVYLTYVESADCDRREWEDMRQPGELDPIKENFDVFGHLKST